MGAKPKVIAPADTEVHPLLAQRIDDGEVEWVKGRFKDEDVTRLGRTEVDHVVDAVFLTSGTIEESKLIDINITSRFNS